MNSETLVKNQCPMNPGTLKTQFIFRFHFSFLLTSTTDHLILHIPLLEKPSGDPLFAFPRFRASYGHLHFQRKLEDEK